MMVRVKDRFRVVVSVRVLFLILMEWTEYFSF